MKTNHFKVLVITIFSFSFLALTFFQTNLPTKVMADDATAAEYKAKCTMCHTAKAEKFFDPAKSIEVLTGVILQGNKTSKPPMPGFESKGMTPEQAKSLAEYMVGLRKPADTNSNTISPNVNANISNVNSNSNNSASNCICPQTNSTVVNSNISNTTSNAANTSAVAIRADEQTIAAYKTKCSGCHSPKAEKFFDPTKTDEVYLEAVLKGKKTTKPPMPGFEEKGLKSDEAKALISYMKSLRVENK